MMKVSISDSIFFFFFFLIGSESQLKKIIIILSDVDTFIIKFENLWTLYHKVVSAHNSGKGLTSRYQRESTRIKR